MSNIKKISIAVVLLFAICLSVFSYYFIRELNNIPETIIASNDEQITELKSHSKFGSMLSVKVDTPQTTPCLYGSNFKQTYACLNLFGIFPVKKVLVNEVVEDKIYASGKTIGIALQSKGVVVIGKNPVLISDEDFDYSNFEIGDIIMQIEGEEITCAEKVEEVINKNEYKGKELVVRAKRNNSPFFTTIKPAYDVQTKKYKLGLWVRDDASGVGTLTYVRPDSLRFGALGHSIADAETGTILEVSDGKLYKCQILSVEKGTKGKAGELRGIFIQSENGEATVDANTPYGIYGNIYENSPLMKDLKLVQIGGRMTAHPGKAQIMCCLDGSNIETFDIDIIKTNYQNSTSDKSLVLRVTDRDLLARTGGIVQGMSGSPIIQDGKLIGAVTHVFVNDPTRGFGIYLDWMIDN